jgi:DNA-binding NtrC family response regulator
MHPTMIDGRKRRGAEQASTKTLASLMGPVLIVNPDIEKSRVVERAVRRICQEIVVTESCEEARVWLDCARSHYVIICPTDGDTSYVDLVKYIGTVRYHLPVVILGEKDQDQRGRMRDIASELKMTIHTFPYPVELSVLRVLLANQRSKTAGLPIAHMWGGVKVDTVVAQHRPKKDAKA